MNNTWQMNGSGIQKYTGNFCVKQMFQSSLVLCFLLLYLVFFPPFLHMCILSAVCLDVLCWTSRLSEKGARSRASPVNRALWLGMADSCWPRPWTAAGLEFAALPWHVWNDPAVVYCAAFVWFMLSYGGPPCNVHPNSRACVWIKKSYFLHALSCVFAPLLCGRELGEISWLWNSISFLWFFFLKNTEWMHELLKAPHHIPPLSPHVFHSCFFGFVVIKAETRFMWTHDK